ncbi:hypothetical protein DICVIV_12254 [Dictyocaulus viviparus]|uniref:Uncharacterized protein n=1 Tax=Dictyocaulus viviparus TaxID=29172 RepID=A0A0D8XDP1_DICVI|nr:hypothetical protein DICVIV_12254 [Dictyocaulus viviparus]
MESQKYGDSSVVTSISNENFLAVHTQLRMICRYTRNGFSNLQEYTKYGDSSVVTSISNENFLAVHTQITHDLQIYQKRLLNLQEYQSKELLSKHGCTVQKFIVAASKQEAEEKMKFLGSVVRNGCVYLLLLLESYQSPCVYCAFAY